MSRGLRASSLGPEARLGRARSPVRFSAVCNTGGAMHPGEEKETMRGLNGRLADYLSQVRLLEEANSRLEAQIREVLTERRATGDRDWSAYEKTISTLRDQMKSMMLENARLMLQIDNARLAADDFKVKFEAEIAVCQGVEQDITNLRKMIDDTNMSHMQLESEIESLTEELIYLKKSHQEDVTNIKGQIRGTSVDVQMETAKGHDLNETIDKIRQQYEKATQKNQEETEAWYRSKFETISAEVSRNTDALQQGQSELNDLRRQKQGLEIDLQGMHSMNHSLDDTLNDTLGHYSQNVKSHNMVIQQLEAELADVLAQVMRQGAEYQALLNIKSKLEEEIATYHSLLEGTGLPSNGVSDLPENDDFRGMGAQEDINIKNIGPVEEDNINDSAAVEDAKIGGNSMGGYDESVEFSLEQALNAAPAVPCYLAPEPKSINEIMEEEVITQKDLELNAANTAMSQQYDQKEAGREPEEDPVILEEIVKEEETVNCVEEIEVENKEKEETVSPMKETVAEKEEKNEGVNHVEDIQVEKESTVSLIEEVQVEKTEETKNLVVDTQVEEAVSSVLEIQEKKVEEAATSEVVIQEEVVVETFVEETVNLVMEEEEAVSTLEDTQANEMVELKPTDEKINAEEEKQEGEEPVKPEKEANLEE